MGPQNGPILRALLAGRALDLILLSRDSFILLFPGRPLGGAKIGVPDPYLGPCFIGPPEAQITLTAVWDTNVTMGYWAPREGLK